MIKRKFMMLKCRYCEKIFFVDTSLISKNRLCLQDKYLVEVGNGGGKEHLCPKVTSHMDETVVMADVIGYTNHAALGAEVLYKPNKEKENND